MKVVGGEWRGRKGGDQGGHKKSDQRGEHAGPRSFDQSSFPPLGTCARPIVPGDHHRDGGKRHLEARPHQLLGGRQHDEAGGESDVPARHGGAAERDGDQHDGGHDERAESRNLRTGEDGIGRCRDERQDGCQRLERRRESEPHRQGKQRADEPEESSGEECHVEARDRHHVVQSGSPERLAGRFWDEASLAGDLGRRDRAVLATDDGDNAIGELVARPVERDEEALVPGQHGRRCPKTLNLPQRETDGPDPVEESVSGEVEATGNDRRGRGFERGPDEDAVARLEISHGPRRQTD
jgi:hypothetical protein